MLCFGKNDHRNCFEKYIVKYVFPFFIFRFVLWMTFWNVLSFACLHIFIYIVLLCLFNVNNTFIENFTAPDWLQILIVRIFLRYIFILLRSKVLIIQFYHYSCYTIKILMTLVIPLLILNLQKYFVNLYHISVKS